MQRSLHEYPAKESLEHREDLSADLAADRPLSLKDLDLLLRLTDFLADKRYDHGARGTAALDVGRLGHKYGIPALLAVIRDDDDDGGVRDRAVIALSMILDKRVVPLLIDEGLGRKRFEDHARINLAQLAGVPPEVTDVSHPIGRAVPKKPADRKKHLQIWHDWWKKNRGKIKLSREFRGVH